MNVSKIYGTIEDTNFFDGSSQNNLSKYTASDNNDSMVYDSDYKAYKLTRTAKGETKHTINNLTIPNTQKISYDILFPTISSINNQPRIIFENLNNLKYIGLRTQAGTSRTLDWYNSDGNISGVNLPFSANVWYHIEIILDGSSNTVNCYNMNNELIGTKTYNNSYLDNNQNNVHITSSYDSSATFYIKNIKIKSL